MIDFEAHFGELRTHADALLARVKAIAENRLEAIRAEEREIMEMFENAVAKAEQIKALAGAAVDHAAGLAPEPIDPLVAPSADTPVAPSTEADAALAAFDPKPEPAKTEDDGLFGG
jgi:hypothetical protein